MTDRADGRAREPLGRRAFLLMAIVVGWVAAAWTLGMSAFCIGETCRDGVRVTWWAWLAIAGALMGTILVLRRRTRPAGVVLLGVPLVMGMLENFVDL